MNRRIKYIFLFLQVLLLAYILHRIYMIMATTTHYHLNSLFDVVQDFGLFETILLLLLILLTYHETLWVILRAHISIFLMLAILLFIKLAMLQMSEIRMDIVYASMIATGVSFELIPLLIIKPYTNRLFIRLLYITMILIILFVNLGTFIYYYYTSKLIEPIIFGNINLNSISGFLVNCNFFCKSLLFIAPCILMVCLYIIVDGETSYNRKWDTERYYMKYYKKVSLLLIGLFILGRFLYFAECITARRISDLYKAERGVKDKIVDEITKNSLLSCLVAFHDFISHNNQYMARDLKSINGIELSDKDKKMLVKLGLLYNPTTTASISVDLDINIPKYDRIILVVFESLSIDFINYYNDKIPKEATPYFNYLLKSYFHLNYYFTSNMPTDFGWTAILKSKLDLDVESDSLFSILNTEGYDSYYIMASSKFYGIKNSYYRKAFRFKHWFYRENLVPEYGEIYSGWGFHNDVIFDKAIRVLKENRNKKIVLATETADFHQPGPYCGFQENQLPLSIRNKSNEVKAVYWIDRTLKDFIHRMEKEDLLDNSTLIIITADHNPHPGPSFKKLAIPGNFRRLARIPLIFITKNRDFKEFRKIENNTCSQVDLLPTLLYIEGVQYTNYNGFFGKDIFHKSNNIRLSKYADNLYYFVGDKLRYKCNIADHSASPQICNIIKKFFYRTQYSE